MSEVRINVTLNNEAEKFKQIKEHYEMNAGQEVTADKLAQILLSMAICNYRFE